MKNSESKRKEERSWKEKIGDWIIEHLSYW